LGKVCHQLQHTTQPGLVAPDHPWPNRVQVVVDLKVVGNPASEAGLDLALSHLDLLLFHVPGVSTKYGAEPLTEIVPSCQCLGFTESSAESIVYACQVFA
jgi:hypothetical protein